MPVSPITISNHTISNLSQKTINAYDLHRCLKMSLSFSEWIKARIKEYRFEKGYDYIIPVGTEKYEITLNMAKELCRVEKTNRSVKMGRVIIDYENRLKEKSELSMSPVYDPASKQVTIEHFTKHVLSMQDKIEKALAALNFGLIDSGRAVNTACVLFPEEIQKARMKGDG